VGNDRGFVVVTTVLAQGGQTVTEALSLNGAWLLAFAAAELGQLRKIGLNGRIEHAPLVSQIVEDRRLHRVRIGVDQHIFNAAVLSERKGQRSPP